MEKEQHTTSNSETMHTKIFSFSENKMAVRDGKCL